MPPYRASKRILDTTVASVLLIVLVPVLAVVVAVMALDMLVSPRDRGTFFYSELRISRGRPFRLLKFRTLTRAALAEMEAAGSHARLYESDTAHLTWAARRILKPWYVDEVPQLLNVLRGDISLVGPRPWPPRMVEQQVAEGKDYRNLVVAGLTGTAQVTKGSGRAFDDLDLEYVERSGRLPAAKLLRYDLQILAQTVRVMARGEGLNY